MKLLAPLARLYGGIMSWRNHAYDQGKKKIYQAPIPIISVGNLSVGGTGKTPMAEYILAELSAKGRKVAYLSRGYGRKTKGYRLVDLVHDTVQSVGDEALQVAMKFPDIPVVVCEDRAFGIVRLLAERSVEILVLDDAFQHRKVARTLDLVMIDAQRLPTQDAVLPQGRLREPIQGLRRADMLVINRVSTQTQIEEIKKALSAFKQPIAFCQPQMQGVQAFGEAVVQNISQLKGQKVVVFSGIGNHEYFVQQIRAMGAIVLAEKGFRDHYNYRERDLRDLQDLCPEQAILLTTEKDYCRLKGRVSGNPWHYIPIKFHWWEGQKALKKKLFALSLLP
ncbi:MAG: tetraacyldisaccharide 4'-kinase [Bacteroidota bacterium]